MAKIEHQKNKDQHGILVEYVTIKGLICEIRLVSAREQQRALSVKILINLRAVRQLCEMSRLTGSKLLPLKHNFWFFSSPSYYKGPVRFWSEQLMRWEEWGRRIFERQKCEKPHRNSVTVRFNSKLLQRSFVNFWSRKFFSREEEANSFSADLYF